MSWLVHPPPHHFLFPSWLVVLAVVISTSHPEQIVRTSIEGTASSTSSVKTVVSQPPVTMSTCWRDKVIGHWLHIIPGGDQPFPNLSWQSLSNAVQFKQTRGLLVMLQSRTPLLCLPNFKFCPRSIAALVGMWMSPVNRLWKTTGPPKYDCQSHFYSLNVPFFGIDK